MTAIVSAGQVWIPMRPGSQARARIVLNVRGKAVLWKARSVVREVPQWLPVGLWRGWVRRHEAVILTAGVTQ